MFSQLLSNGEIVKLAFEELTPEEPLERAKKDALEIKWGIKTPNEARIERGMDPKDNNDVDVEEPEAGEGEVDDEPDIDVGDSDVDIDVEDSDWPLENVKESFKIHLNQLKEHEATFKKSLGDYFLNLSKEVEGALNQNRDNLISSLSTENRLSKKKQLKDKLGVIYVACFKKGIEQSKRDLESTIEIPYDTIFDGNVYAYNGEHVNRYDRYGSATATVTTPKQGKFNTTSPSGVTLYP